jgi:hypothetical protein
LFLSAIESCALLHQYQRELDDSGRLIASDWDYAIVAELLSGWLVETLAGGVSKTTAAFHQWLKAEFCEGQDITIADCQQQGKSVSSALYHVQKLVQAGLLQQLTSNPGGGRGRGNVYRLVVGDVAQRSVGLPAVSAVEEFCRGS